MVIQSKCEACGYNAKKLKQYAGIRGPKWLCEICAETFSGNICLYEANCDDQNIIYMLVYCTNKIIDALKDSRQV